jgi:hypothetical protein
MQHMETVTVPKPATTIRSHATSSSLSAIVYIAVGAFIAAILLPPALNQIFTTNTSAWNSAVVPIFSILLPVLVILAVALYFFKKL